jgi:hypothetical protein
LRTYCGRGDNLVVSTEALAEILRTWIARHDSEHPSWKEMTMARKKQGGEYVGGFSGKQFLAFHSGRNLRSIDRILRHESQYTTLSFAESLLMVIDQEYELANGRLEVVVDPRYDPNRKVVTKVPGRGQQQEEGVSS